MEKEKLFIPIILGTRRDGRMSEHVANYILKRVQDNPEIDTQLFDPRDFNFPADDEAWNLKDLNTDYAEAVAKCDALIIVAPEYNRGYSGSLKTMLDMLTGEYVHKAAGLVGVSSGGFGGVRVIESLLSPLRELGVTVTFSDINVSKVQDVFKEDGTVTDEKMDGRVDKFLEELIWMSRVLKWGRENLPNKYHE